MLPIAIIHTKSIYTTSFLRKVIFLMSCDLQDAIKEKSKITHEELRKAESSINAGDTICKQSGIIKDAALAGTLIYLTLFIGVHEVAGVLSMLIIGSSIYKYVSLSSLLKKEKLYLNTLREYVQN